MCSLGKEIIKVHQLKEKDAMVGYRGWYIKRPFNPINNRILSSLNFNNEFSTDITEFICNQESYHSSLERHICGIYSYNNNYNYSNDNNYYYYNYYNYNNNNYYNYYNNNYYYYNYNYNNYHYYIAGEILSFGQVIEHKLGYRAEKAKVSKLVLLTPKEDLDEHFLKFLEHFNTVIKESAKLYKVPTINHIDWK